MSGQGRHGRSGISPLGIRTWGMVTVLLHGVFTMWAPVAQAQFETTPSPLPPPPPPALTRPATLPFTDVDSARMVLGHRNFATYETPGDCLSAARVVQDDAERDLLPDTLTEAVRLGVMSAANVALLRHCASHFAAAATAPRELYNLVSLSLMLGDDQRADSAAGRLVAAAATTKARAQILLRLMISYLRVPPPQGGDDASRHRRATRFEQQLMALGVAAWNQQLTAKLYRYRDADADAPKHWHWNGAERIHDALAILQWCDALPSVVRDSMLHQLSLSGMDMGRQLLEAKGTEDPAHLAAFGDSLRAASPTFATWGGGYIPQELALFRLVGAPAPPPRHDFWFNTRDQSVWPRPGVISLLVEEGQGTLNFHDIAVLRRLAARYGEQLDITIRATTAGYSPHSGPQTSAEEAVSDSAYFLGTLKLLQLPASLMVVASQFTTLPDGHVEVNYRREPGWEHARTLLVDQQGRVLVASPWLPEPARLTMAIDSALRQ